MNNSVIIIVKLKTKDPVSESAFQCLTGEMDYQASLQSLTRYDYWDIQVSPGIDRLELGRYLATETKLFVNPNKHTFEYHLAESVPAAMERAASGEHIHRLLVRDNEDSKGTEVLHHLHRLYNLPDKIMAVRSGVLWILRIKAADPDDAQSIAREIAMTRNRKSGLLANPQSQTISFGLTTF
ncbi:hypothetical protein JXA40_00050 [bacterium]|nr:hypothetical protein [candidate division CSSED10-310 bacterium]